MASLNELLLLNAQLAEYAQRLLRGLCRARTRLDASFSSSSCLIVAQGSLLKRSWSDLVSEISIPRVSSDSDSNSNSNSNSNSTDDVFPNTASVDDQLEFIRGGGLTRLLHNAVGSNWCSYCVDRARPDPETDVDSKTNCNLSSSNDNNGVSSMSAHEQEYLIVDLYKLFRSSSNRVMAVHSDPQFLNGVLRHVLLLCLSPHIAVRVGAARLVLLFLHHLECEDDNKHDSNTNTTTTNNNNKGTDISEDQARSFSKELYDRWFDMNVWFDALSSFTFRTVFIPMTASEAASLVVSSTLSASPDFVQTCEQLRSRFALSIAATSSDSPLSSLQSKLDDAIVNNFGSRAFVKAGSRSPKDAACVGDRYFGHLQSLVRDASGIDPSSSSSSTSSSQTESSAQLSLDSFPPSKRVEWMREASSAAMMVCDGKEALQLLQSSHRVVDDIVQALSTTDSDRGPNECCSLPLVVREFVTLRPRYEFRAFVRGRKLVALSQYFANCYFEGLSTVLPDVVSCVRETFDRICAMSLAVLPYVDFVADVAVVESKTRAPGDSNNSFVAYLVELNPYGRCSSGCLFSWVKDCKLLLDGVGEFECRVVDKDPDQ